MTKIEQMYLETTRLESHQAQLRNPSVLGTIIDITASAEYKKEVHKIYTSCGLYPKFIGYDMGGGLSFSTPHMYYSRITLRAWKRKFSDEERAVFEQALS